MFLINTEHPIRSIKNNNKTDLVRGADHPEAGEHEAGGGVGGRAEVGRQQLGRLDAVIGQRAAVRVQRRRRHLRSPETRARRLLMETGDFNSRKYSLICAENANPSIT